MLISKFPLIEINDNEVSQAKEHVFFFKDTAQIKIITRATQLLKTLPNQTALKLWLRTEFDIFVHMEEEGKGAKAQKQQEDEYLSELILQMMIENQFTFLKFERDPFADQPRLVKNDITLEYYAPKLFLLPYTPDHYELTEDTIVAVVRDYLEHFPQFDEILKWIVACRFTNQRRNSYVYLRVNAGFGKSIFASIFEGIRVGKKIKQSQLKDNSAGDLAPEAFRNVLAMIIDEFTHFSQEMKDITNYISMSAKYQLNEVVPLYAKIFMSAEKSTSFYGDAGVDSQLADRVNVIDLAVNGAKIEDREAYKHFGNAVYVDALRIYTMKTIAEESDRYISLGKVEADKNAVTMMNSFYAKYKVQATTIGKIRERIYDYLVDYVDWGMEQAEMRQRNTFFEQLLPIVYIKNEDEVVIKDPVKMYEIMLKFSGDQFAKVAKFKQTSLDEILNTPLTKDRQNKVKGRNIKGTLVNLPYMMKGKKNVPVDFVDAEGNIDGGYKFDGENILDADGKEIF